jgi:lycopene beta-cyclase
MPHVLLFSTHQWSNVAYAGTHFRRSVSCAETPYTLIRGDDFFGALLEELEQAGVLFSWDCPAVEVSTDSICVGTHSTTFDVVIDAAFSPTPGTSILWQSFAGMWVRSKHPYFDPTTATLMDLDVVDSSAAVRFVYLLPTSPTTALIEHTVFAHSPLPQEEHVAACAEWIERQGYGELEVCEHEYGRIPMGLQLHRQPDAPLTIGSAGGAIRTSTGYAFQAIRKEALSVADAIAAGVRKGGPLSLSRQSPWPLWMRVCDNMFIRALAKMPSQGQFIMSELLRRAPERELVPFLAGSASLPQAVQVMRCVPKWCMLRALMKLS